MKLIIFSIITLVSWSTNVCAQELLKNRPDFLTPCYIHKGDEECYRRNLEATFVYWKDGLPGIKSSMPIDPFHLKKVRLSHKSENLIDLQVELTDLTVSGASNLKIAKTTIDDKVYTYKIKVILPVIKLASNYKIKGNILVLNLNGQGTLVGEAVNLEASLITKTALKRIGDEYLFDVLSVTSHIDKIDGFRINFANLFNGNKELEDSANAFINEGWRDIFQLMRPTFEKTLDKIFYDRAKAVFAHVPGRFYFADLP